MKNTLLRTTAALLGMVFCGALLLLTACASIPDSGQQPVPDTAEPVVGESADSADDTVVTMLGTCIADEESKSRFSTVYSYGNDPYEKYMIWCESEVTDLYIVRLATDAETWVTDGVRVFELDSLKPGEGIYYNMMVPEGVPWEAIIYTVGGKTYTYAVSYNGRDGGISFIEIDTLITDADIYNHGSFPGDSSDPADEMVSSEITIEVFRVDAGAQTVFAKEMTIESDSKWHVWKALKMENPTLIPIGCSLLSCEPSADKEGVAALDFSKEFADIAYVGCEELVLKAIANTYISAYNFDSVRFLIEGAPYESDICQPGMEFSYTGF